MPAMVKPSIQTFMPLKLLNGGSSATMGRTTATMAMPARTVVER